MNETDVNLMEMVVDDEGNKQAMTGLSKKGKEKMRKDAESFSKPNKSSNAHQHYGCQAFLKV